MRVRRRPAQARQEGSALALGCEEFHVKPISFELFMRIIVETLDRWVAGKRAAPT